MSSGRFVGGLLVGGALGLIIGLLSAPRQGEETRRMIHEEFSDRLEDSLDSVKSSANAFKGKTLETVEQLQTKGQQVATDMEATGRETWDKVHTAVKPNRNPGRESPAN